MESSKLTPDSKKKCCFLCAVNNNCRSKSLENADLSYHFFLPTVGILSKSTIILVYPKNQRVGYMEESNKKKRREIPFKGVFYLCLQLLIPRKKETFD